MISEALIFLLTPTSTIAKKYGFLYSSIALKSRYERCKKSWLPHLKNCQNLFLQSIQNLPSKQTVVILGSAHLHEIPLHLLVENFAEIILVDVIHPLKHHFLAKKNTRLKLITQDLSGVLSDLENIKDLKSLQQKMNLLENQQLFHFKADLIISANILSQLGLLPIEALEKALKRPLDIKEKDLICTRFANLHLKNLKSCDGKKLMYSDRLVTYKDPQGKVIYEGKYPVNLATFKKIKEWVWLIAPLKEASKEYSIEMTIEAYES